MPRCWTAGASSWRRTGDPLLGGRPGRRSSLTTTTVIQLTGDALHLIGEACSVARSLQPAMLVVEDVGEMDGLAEDADGAGI